MPPTLTFCCGAECGIVAAGAATGTTLHWTGPVGTVTTSTAISRNTGGRSYQFVAASAPCRLEKNVGTPTVGVLRVYVYFPSTDLPDVDCTIAGFVGASGNTIGIQYKAATNTLTALAIATTGGSVAVVADTWMRLDIRCTVSAVHLVEWSVDGVAQTSASQGAATTLATLRIGCQLTGTTTVVGGTMYADDIALSATSGDYPIGAGKIVKLTTAADGTHSFNAAGDFKYNDSTNIATNATDTWSYVDDILTSITDFLSINGAAAGEYLEWTMGTIAEVADTINGVEVVTAHHSQSTASNKQTLRMVDGVSTNDVMTDADFSNTSITYGTKHYSAGPAGAWTQATVQALKFRWAGSFTAVDNTPAPYIDGLTLEVDYVPNLTPIRSLQLTAALMCFTIDHLVILDPGELTGPPTAQAQGAYVRAFGARQTTDQVHRYMRGETPRD